MLSYTLDLSRLEGTQLHVADEAVLQEVCGRNDRSVPLGSSKLVEQTEVLLSYKTVFSRLNDPSWYTMNGLPQRSCVPADGSCLCCPFTVSDMLPHPLVITAAVQCCRYWKQLYGVANAKC